jgi:hypothetical protein
MSFNIQNVMEQFWDVGFEVVEVLNEKEKHLC